MLRVRSFPPIEDASARVLILGSMPGAASLAAARYYAHPQNLFWPIMGALLGAPPGLTYGARVRLLKARGIAVWDVLESCVREGSLDSAIEEDTIAVNDFAAFYRAHPLISAVFFNGAKAEAAYRRYVRAAVEGEGAPRAYFRMPSTSPAHATLSFGQKLEAWKGVLAFTRAPAK
ncbi:MAG: DNA-deoxyinosine glycosylase [Betaproteobacteria bacterium]